MNTSLPPVFDTSTLTDRQIKDLEEGRPVPIASMPAFQEALRKGLEDSSLVLTTGDDIDAPWSEEDIARLDAVLTERLQKRNSNSSN